jgi:hypothetical protein
VPSCGRQWAGRGLEGLLGGGLTKWQSGRPVVRGPGAVAIQHACIEKAWQSGGCVGLQSRGPGRPVCCGSVEQRSSNPSEHGPCGPSQPGPGGVDIWKACQAGSWWA